jgi:hypothetical protein
MKRSLKVTAALGATMAIHAGSALAAPPSEVAVGGAVAAPSSYALAQLAALPQTTFTVDGPWGRSVSETGVALESLVEQAGPDLPAVKNALLRVTITVAGRGGRSVTFALGELDSFFGDHPAYLALSINGRRLHAAELVVPGDRLPLRTIRAVRKITVAVENPVPSTPPATGDLTVQDGPFTKVLTAAQLAALPAETLQVTFQAGTATQTDTEIGPTLQAVLSLAGIHAGPDTWVAAVGSDGYVATVTPAEAFLDPRPLLISLNENGQPLTQPRLVTDGDVKGGRYVSGVDNLVVGAALVAGRAWWRL